MSNPLLQSFKTPLGAIPFNKIKLEHYKPAIIESIKAAKAEIETIKKNKSKADFSNTIEAFERSGSRLETVSTVFFNLNSAETCNEMQELAQEISPLLTAYSNEIMMDEKLFEKIKEAYDNTDKSSLTAEQAMLSEKSYKEFIRSGAMLDKESKKKLKAISEELSKLGLKYGEHVLKETKEYELWISDKEDLSGLPESIIQAAKQAADERNKNDLWLFTLDYPSYMPFMKYADNRELRKKFFLAFGSKAFQNNDYNNEKIVSNIVTLRHQKAELLGYNSHADLVLEERMAKNTKNVFKLLDELLLAAKPATKMEIDEVQELCNDLKGPEKMQRWDFSYYSEKLKEKKYAINDEILKPYFKLKNVIEGAFETANKLYGISFVKRNDIPVYHPDVETYEVLDENSDHLAVFYADFFPREGKRGGAWMTSYKGQNKYDGISQRPHVSIVCNFTKPTTDKPSLLTFNEVTTLFHEFGHALHGMLADGFYESLSGTSVYWDFVELPSQIMENWCYEKECLDLFAKHFETGETIPFDLVKKIKDSANFLSGYNTIRQVSFAMLDMAWHQLTGKPDHSVPEFEKMVMKETELFPEVSGVNMSCSFSHIFQGGYSAGYYSYKWAEVLEADAFEYFKETGIFNKVTASEFRDSILSKGGSEHPMELYKRFRGSEPSTKPLLKKSGLIKGSE